jgi:hypothetical protein
METHSTYEEGMAALAELEAERAEEKEQEGCDGLSRACKGCGKEI